MYKIAILGCENIHADAFISIVKEKKAVSDVEFIGVYSDEPEAMQKLNEKWGVPMMKRYDELVGRVDGIMITARHGDNHYKYAKPYIDDGIPMFIDKPITVSEEDALAFMHELKSKGIKAVGGSGCVYMPEITDIREKLDSGELGKILGGFFRGPINPVNNYGGFFFYTQHVAQVMCYLLGYYPKSVKAYVNGKVTTVVVRYEDYDAVMEYVEGSGLYYAGVSCQKAYVGETCPVNEDIYIPEFMHYYDILTGKEQNQCYEQLIAPVFVLNAIKRSINSGEEESVNIIGEI